MPAISYPNMSIHNRTRQNGQAGIDVEILGLGCPRPDQLSMRKNALNMERAVARQAETAQSIWFFLSAASPVPDWSSLPRSSNVARHQMQRLSSAMTDDVTNEEEKRWLTRSLQARLSFPTD
jgi:hypothetical protein